MTNKEFNDLDRFEQKLLSGKIKKRKDTLYKLEDTLYGEPYFLFDDIMGYLSRNYKKDFDYLFVITKDMLNPLEDEDEDEDTPFKYELFYANRNNPQFESTRGSLTIESAYFDKDITKLKFVLLMIKTAFAKGSGKANILVVSNMPKSDLEEELELPDGCHYLDIGEMKKMALQTEVIEKKENKIKYILLPILLSIIVPLFLHSQFGSIAEEKITKFNKQISDTKSQINIITSEVVRAKKKLNKYRQYENKDISNDSL
jgi:cell division protein FtsB